MKDLLQILARSLQEGRALCYCRLVETRGSTPQKAGAAMLVFVDGSQTGSLGGGCVEAEVKRKALALLAGGEAEVAKFTLDHDYGWDDGLICGGRMSVLLDPLRADVAAERKKYYQSLIELGLFGEGLTEAVVFESTNGIVSPQAFLFGASNQLIMGWRESSADLFMENLTPLLDRPRPYVKQGVAYLPLLPRSPLVIVGAGHVGQAVSNLAHDLDFEVTVVDDRADYLTEPRFPHAKERLPGRIDELLPKLHITQQTYCLIVTRGHNHDQEALYHLVNRGARYVGMIGSKRKIKLIFDALRDAGISDESLAKVFAPIGINIGSLTVPEIAVSICAELVSHRNRGGIVPGRPDVGRVSLPVPGGDETDR